MKIQYLKDDSLKEVVGGLTGNNGGNGTEVIDFDLVLGGGGYRGGTLTHVAYAAVDKPAPKADVIVLAQFTVPVAVGNFLLSLDKTLLANTPFKFVLVGGGGGFTE